MFSFGVIFELGLKGRGISKFQSAFSSLGLLLRIFFLTEFSQETNACSVKVSLLADKVFQKKLKYRKEALFESNNYWPDVFTVRSDFSW